MKRSLLALALAVSTPALSAVTTPNQDFYLAAVWSQHELENLDGDKYSVVVGARNYHENNWFYGGELTGAYIDNKKSGTVNVNGIQAAISIKEQYSLGAIVPVGKRLNLVEGITLDVYGLAGYTMTRLKGTVSIPGATASEKTTVHGPRWGAGLDAVFSDYRLGIRWTRASLDGDDIRDSLREENISLLVGYQF